MSFRRRQGSILVEALTTQLMIFVSLVLGWELCRRSFFEITLQHAAFLAARGTIVGDRSSATHQQVEGFAARALGKPIGRRMARQFQDNPLCLLQPGFARLKFRFRSLFPVHVQGRWKHHFMMTKTCRFPSTF